MKIDSKDKNEPDRRLVGRQAAVCHRDIVRWLNLRCHVAFGSLTKHWVKRHWNIEEILKY